MEQQTQEASNQNQAHASQLDLLIADVVNEDQVTILEKLRSEDPKDAIYYVGFEKLEITKKKKAYCQFIMKGALRKKKGELKREEHKITLHEHQEKGSFWCTCASHKFHAVKRGIVCKHICFLVLKLANIWDAGFFKSKQLTHEQFKQVCGVAEHTYQGIINVITNNVAFTTNKKKELDPEDRCPICYDDLGKTKPALSCPTCFNYVHQDCIEVWLECHKVCVFCRSKTWSKYVK